MSPNVLERLRATDSALKAKDCPRFVVSTEAFRAFVQDCNNPPPPSDGAKALMSKAALVGRERALA